MVTNTKIKRRAVPSELWCLVACIIDVSESFFDLSILINKTRPETTAVPKAKQDKLTAFTLHSSRA